MPGSMAALSIGELRDRYKRYDTVSIFPLGPFVHGQSSIVARQQPLSFDNACMTT
jgi:hypothetical protein